MRRILFTLCLLLSIGSLSAQEKENNHPGGSFDPKQFESNLEQYVVKEAGLTKAEEEKFLPVYQEMRAKQVQVMKDERTSHEKAPATEKECEALIKAHDAQEIELKKLVETYHNKMLSVIPASKLMKVIKAERDFHRDSFRQHVGTTPPPRPRK